MRAKPVFEAEPSFRAVPARLPRVAEGSLFPESRTRPRNSAGNRGHSPGPRGAARGSSGSETSVGSAVPTAQYHTGFSDAEGTAADVRDARTGSDLDLDAAPFLTDFPAVRPVPPGDWPAIPTRHPAPSPYPWRSPDSPERENCFGVGNDKLGELPSVAAVAPMAFMNRPQSSVDYTPLADGDFVTSDGRGAQRNDGFDMPRPRRLDDLYNAFDFCPQTHGGWVSQQVRRQIQTIRRAGKRPAAADRLWRLKPADFAHEIARWVRSNAADLDAALSRARRVDRGEDLPPWKPKTKGWIIPPEAVQPWARTTVWELRFFWDWYTHRKGDGRIVPLRRVLCPPTPRCRCCYKPRRPPSWNLDWLRSTCAASHCPDREQVGMLCSQGTDVPFDGTMSTVLVPNAMGLYYEITAATALAETEQGQGYTDGPHAGIPFQPSKTHSHNMAISIRGGKIKKRGTGNLTGSGEHQADSTNAGRDVSTYAPMAFVTSAEFCRCLYIISQIGLPLELRKFDWSEFYRQCLRHPAGWWLSVYMTLSSGLVVDERLIMGDASCCHSGNRVETILVWLMRYLLLTHIWGWSAELYDQPDRWVSAVLQRPWAQTEPVRAWIRHRVTSLGGPTQAMNRADRMAALFNLLPIVLGGYFDDSMLGGIVGLCDEQTDAILFLIRELGIGAAWAKFERAQADGTIGLMVPSDRAHLTKHRRWTKPTPGFGQVLGKEIDLSLMERRDAKARIRDLSALMDEILASVNASPTRAVDLVLVQKVVGIVVYITDTSAPIRALLNYTVRALKIRNGFRPGSTGRSRRAFLIECRAKGVDAPASVFSWPGRQGTYTTLSRSAEAEWRELQRVLPLMNGAHFMPRRSPLGRHGVVHIMNDSAGYEGGVIEGKVLNGAAWLMSHGWTIIPHLSERWDIEVLKATHSTQQEFANGNANLIAVLSRMQPDSDGCYHDVIEVYDNQATVSMAWRLATHSPDLVDLLHERFVIIQAAQARGIRVVQLWTDRAGGAAADDLSKGALSAATAFIAKYSPGIELQPEPLSRHPNLLTRTLSRAYRADNPP